MMKPLVFSAIAGLASLAACQFDSMGTGSGQPGLPDDPAVLPGPPAGPRFLDTPGSSYFTHAPFVLAVGQHNANHIQVTPYGLYWLSESAFGPQLVSSSLTGGAADPKSELGGSVYGALVLGDKLLFTDPAAGQLLTIPLEGGVASKLTGFDVSPTALVLDGDYAYVATDDGCVVRAWLGGGSVEPIACADGTPTNVARAEGHVFWTTAEGELWRAPASGGAAELVVKDRFGDDLVVDADRLYWVDDVAGEVHATDHAGKGGVTVLGGAQGSPTSLAGDGQNLFFTVKDDGSVWKLDKTTGAQTRLASNQGAPDGLVVAGDRLYWANQLGGEVVTYLAY